MRQPHQSSSIVPISLLTSLLLTAPLSAHASPSPTQPSLPSTTPSPLANFSIANELANLSGDAKYYPAQEPLLRRNFEVEARLLNDDVPVVAVRKMSLDVDPGEKFWVGYWGFEGEDGVENIIGETTDHNENTKEQEGVCARRNTSTTPENWIGGNGSLPIAVSFPPFPVHAVVETSSTHFYERFLHSLLFARGALDARAFTCPTGTDACTSISRPNSCCPTSETCELITDTGYGDVGCCAAGMSCSGELSGSSCSDQGYTSCPSSEGGGCCIPGYECQGVGCVSTATTTVVVTATATVIESSSTTAVVVTTTERLTSTTPSVSATTTVTKTTTPSTSSTKTTAAETCRTGYFSCPATLGGGCCPTGRVCAIDSCPASSTSSSASTATTTKTTTKSTTAKTTSTSNSLGNPVRPTSASTYSLTLTGVSGTATCPQNFYACSAVYGGGCCQTGRDCAVTSCPSTSSTTIITGSDGVATVIVDATATGASVASFTASGSCPTGWDLCASSFGGGCCPSGFACGTASCSATGSGTGTGVVPTATVAKEGESYSSDGIKMRLRGYSWVFVVGGIAAGLLW